ncbi:MAG: TVP38/TMEM64 family protein, partial [Brachybacterium tyrofermentans]
MSTTTQPMQLTPLAPTISTLTGRSTTTDRAPARTPATAAAAASAAASDGAAATATAGARTGASTRDPVRIAARLSPLLGLGISIALVWWGLQTGVLQSLENLQAFITS